MKAYVRRPGTISDVVDGSVAVCDTVSGEVFELNGTAAALWTWCETAETAAAMAARLGEAYPGTDRGLLRDDVELWLSEAQAAGLVTVVDLEAEG